MKLSAVASVLAFFAAVQAAPFAIEGIDDVSANPASEIIYTLNARASINNCGDSSFENQSTGGSPFISDCQQITRNIAGGGSWTFPLIGHRKLVSYGTCAFGVEGSTEIGHTNGKIGNQDIIDLINDSIRKFSWNGRVGAKGYMTCRYDPTQYFKPTWWFLYHN